MSDVSPPDERQRPALLPLGLLLLTVALWVLGWLVARLILAPSP